MNPQVLSSPDLSAERQQHQYLPGLRHCPDLESSFGNMVPVSRVKDPQT